MPKVSNYTRTRIELLHKQGLHPAGIFRSLKNEGLLVSLASVLRIVKKLQLTGSVANLPRSGRPAKLSVSSIGVGGMSAFFCIFFCVGFSNLIFLHWISQLLPPTTESNIVIKYGNQNQNPGHWSGTSPGI